MVDIFISYARADKAAAAQVARGFQARGKVVWWDADIPAGVEWEDFIPQRLREAKIVVVLWTSASVTRPYVREEARIARDAGKLLQAFVEPIDPPFGFGHLQGVKLAGWTGDQTDPEWMKLCSAVDGPNEADPHVAPPRAAPHIAAPVKEPEPPLRKRNWALWTGGLVAVAATFAAFQVFGSKRDEIAEKASLSTIAPATTTGETLPAPAPAPDAEPTLITSPKWARLPNAADFERYYPDRAVRENMGGRVLLDCIVNANGFLQCGVASEDPPGWGFGAAALAISASFKMSPRLANGQPTDGGRVHVPITFKLADDEPSSQTP